MAVLVKVPSVYSQLLLYVWCKKIEEVGGKECCDTQMRSVREKLRKEVYVQMDKGNEEKF